ncbi:hypothetical protein WICPIJ_000596 [Wickerhamomyces pijperi]|uniref:Uncharacterized protein n=1 Tax=Wickerhamomyces pijperi TaxID=599730 RepID=A0A9P8QCC4_WICPI|nr:hypothetical protein WICPIJ_000596 [Wickerhamomyces pijperi]
MMINEAREKIKGRALLKISLNGVINKMAARSNNQIGAYSKETLIEDTFKTALIKVVPNTAKPKPVPTTPKYIIIKGQILTSMNTRVLVHGSDLVDELESGRFSVEIVIWQPERQQQGDEHSDDTIHQVVPSPAFLAVSHVHLLEPSSNQTGSRGR